MPEKQQAETTSKLVSSPTQIIEHTPEPSESQKAAEKTLCDSADLPSRKHSRSPSPITSIQECLSVTEEPTASSVESPAASVSSEKPAQKNKGRCFKCRVKVLQPRMVRKQVEFTSVQVPLAKQTINRCRCDYVFCDSHRYPDRHECEFDYAKLGRGRTHSKKEDIHFSSPQ
ncbi:zinc finger domain-containing protein [Apophysomyces ossiformis]|uniref:Zinc finger domain-containing protein n=1 Tax=Apophysomyces ossiformis TaxID=679940 RepID=A0A8H7BYB1_9FUNG|nr:zinc finger domain-containing protein [Apophysomyces ossiformis]